MRVLIARSDYKPLPNMSKYPRTTVHLSEGDQNPTNAWAWRADIGDPIELVNSAKLLTGKTVAMKDTICVAGIPSLLGTDVFHDCIRP